LFRGIELTKHSQKRVPFAVRDAKISPGTTVVDEVSSLAGDHGVYVANLINTLILAPPLVVDQTDIDEAVAALDAALEHSDDEMEA
jgi:taurine--2-oxoglutarate transaminase